LRVARIGERRLEWRGRGGLRARRRNRRNIDGGRGQRRERQMMKLMMKAQQRRLPSTRCSLAPAERPEANEHQPGRGRATGG